MSSTHTPPESNASQRLSRSDGQSLSVDAAATSPSTAKRPCSSSPDESAEEPQRYGLRVVSRIHRACTGCRRQKMRCEGPLNKPCNRCQSTGQACLFEKPSMNTGARAMNKHVLDRLAAIEKQMTALQETVHGLMNVMESQAIRPMLSQQVLSSMSAPVVHANVASGQRHQQQRPDAGNQVYQPVRTSSDNSFSSPVQTANLDSTDAYLYSTTGPADSRPLFANQLTPLRQGSTASQSHVSFTTSPSLPSEPDPYHFQTPAVTPHSGSLAVTPSTTERLLSANVNEARRTEGQLTQSTRNMPSEVLLSAHCSPQSHSSGQEGSDDSDDVLRNGEAGDPGKGFAFTIEMLRDLANAEAALNAVQAIIDKQEDMVGMANAAVVASNGHPNMQADLSPQSKRLRVPVTGSAAMDQARVRVQEFQRMAHDMNVVNNASGLFGFIASPPSSESVTSTLDNVSSLPSNGPPSVFTLPFAPQQLQNRNCSLSMQFSR